MYFRTSELSIATRVPIPAEVSFHDGLKACQKLGLGRMTAHANAEDLKYTLDLFREIGSACKYTWTPFSDQDSEGNFLNIFTGKPPKFLPWALDYQEPDGGDKQNYVFIDLETATYFDYSEKYPVTCSVCDINKTLRFKLIGVCKDTAFGEFICMHNMF